MFCENLPLRIASLLRGAVSAHLCALTLVFANIAFIQAEESKKPNLKEQIFEADKIILADERKAEIVNALTAVAVAEFTHVEVRQKTLAIVLRLDSLCKRAFLANEMLAQGKEPRPFPQTWGDLNQMEDRLWGLADELK